MRAIAALAACLGLALSLAACKPAAGPGQASDADMSLGSPTAKVTVAEYASVGCPICAKWNNDNFDAFRAKYVDTGKVRYVLKEMLTGDEPVAAAGFLLARCAGKDKYFQVVDAIFRQEQDLLEHGNGAEERDRLLKVGESAGLTDQQINACISDDKALIALKKRIDDASQAAKIDSTPTFMINGKTTLTGYQDMAALDKAIADAGAAAK
jgi:protein-disulfide isomerase